LICVLVMALTFAVVIPVLGIMYMDMNNALYRAEHETRKMKELRLKVLREMRGE
jgi:hypothetical protein